MTIMLINMTVVFGVLGALGVLMWIIHIVDPTKKKSVTASEPVASSAPVATASKVDDEEETTLLLIAAAIAAYGYSASQIVSIRPLGRHVWAQSASIENVRSNSQRF